MAKKTNSKSKNTGKLYNEVTLSMYLHEVDEKKKCDIFKCSFNNGKDENGDYKPSTSIGVIVTDKTKNGLDEDFESGWITVTGSMMFEYNNYKGKTYCNPKIFASMVAPVE